MKGPALHASVAALVQRTSAHVDQVHQLVEGVMALAFGPERTPRSEAYRLGMRDTLLARALDGMCRCPYQIATAEADAWFAGCDEGRAIWRDYAPSVPPQAPSVR